jgi:hypothetical protein
MDGKPDGNPDGLPPILLSLPACPERASNLPSSSSFRWKPSAPRLPYYAPRVARLAGLPSLSSFLIRFSVKSPCVWLSRTELEQSIEKGNTLESLHCLSALTSSPGRRLGITSPRAVLYRRGLAPTSGIYQDPLRCFCEIQGWSVYEGFEGIEFFEWESGIFEMLVCEASKRRFALGRTAEAREIYERAVEADQTAPRYQRRFTARWIPYGQKTYAARP